MSSLLNGSRLSPKGSRVPTDLLPPAIRYEAARAAIFEDWGNYIRANECLGPVSYTHLTLPTTSRV